MARRRQRPGRRIINLLIKEKENEIENIQTAGRCGIRRGSIVFDDGSPARQGKGRRIERKVTEAEVPKAALNALVKEGRRAEITEFAEEIEYAARSTKASWKNKSRGERRCPGD